MTPTQAREKRRTVVEDLRASLRTISAGNACLRSIESCEAMATAYQCLGRLAAIDEQECYAEACRCGQTARSPRPSIIPDAGTVITRPACAQTGCNEPTAYGSMLCESHRQILSDILHRTQEQINAMSYGERMARLPYMPEITPEMETEAARRMARQTEPAMPDSVLEAMAEAWDRGDQDAVQAIVGQVKLDGRS